MQLRAQLMLTPDNLGPKEDATFAWLAFSDDGLRIAAGRMPPVGDGELVIIDGSCLAILRRIKLKNLGLFAFAPGTYQLQLRSHDLEVDGGEPVARERQTTQRLGGSGAVRIGAFEEGNVELFEAGSTRTIETGATYVNQVTLAPDDTQLLVSSDDVRLTMHGLADGQKTQLSVPPWYSDFCFNLGSTRVAVAYSAFERRGLVVADSQTGATLEDGTGPAPTAYAHAVATHPTTGALAVLRASHTDDPMDRPPQSAWLELYDWSLTKPV